MKTLNFDIAVIGAGPAGLMAAYSASSKGASVILLEKNDIPGVKLLMTGKERCNITNSETDVRKFSEKFGKNGKFLLSALLNFGITETIDFFNKNNLKTKIERGGRIFPESDKAKDVQTLFIRLLKLNKVFLHTGCNIKKIISQEKHIEKLVTDRLEIMAENYIICTGGLSYPKTGSTGDGYLWAEQMGHKIKKPEPSLTPVLVHEKWVKELEGLSLKNVEISIYQNNKKQDFRFGEALFTDKGLTGPVILDMSKNVGELLKNSDVQLFIDFKPALDFQILDKRILRDFAKSPLKLIKNTLTELLPQKLIPIILKLSKISPEKKCHLITKDERKLLLRFLKQFPLKIRGLLGFNKAIITSGGVSLKEINPDTMSSKIISNLYFAGEIIDLDAPTGGYNLQLCWSSGYLAGQSVLK